MRSFDGTAGKAKKIGSSGSAEIAITWPPSGVEA
jgi:hypothetical protein